MRKLSSLTLLIVLMPLSAHAQNQYPTLYPKKDLAFAQVAAGDQYDTVISVTNRGPNTYNGILSLYTQAGQAWSPLVNGDQITNGQMNIAILKGATATYRITKVGGTEAGFAVILASDLLDSGAVLNNFLEGTLTYFVYSGSTLVDSVGVQPSSEFYLTAIPFDDFSTIAYALANLNTATVTPRLSLYSDTNVLVASTNLPQFAPGQHMAEYLRQRFQGAQITRGRLEIQSDLPIIGTILTDNYDTVTQLSQLSSLPMLPAVKAYTFSGSIGVISVTGELSFWLDGRFVQGYLRVLTFGGVQEPNPDTLSLTGSLADGLLQMIASGNPKATNSLLVNTFIESFSLSQTTLQGLATAWWLDNSSLAGTGTLTLQATN